LNFDLVTIVFIVGFALVAMTALLIILALRHDQVVRTAGPLRILQDIEAQISSIRGEKAEIEAELKARREALMDLATVQAEIDALIRQRDELLAAHATLADRREEVRAMNVETEAAIVRYAEAKRDLDEKKEALDLVQAKLDRADRLVTQIATMTEEHDTLSRKLTEIRDELRDLSEAKLHAEELRSKVEKLEREDARLTGTVEAAREQLTSLKSKVEIEERRVAEAQAGNAQNLAQAEAMAAETRQHLARHAELDEQRSRLEALVAQLESKADRLEGLIERVHQEEQRLATAQDGNAKAKEQAAALVAEIRQTTTRHAELEQSRNAAEARLAYLHGEIARSTGKNPDGETADPLDELKVLPPVLAQLAKLSVRDIELESAALHRVSTHMQALGLEYPKRVINAFHTAMKVNETSQMAVLAGISGTGKSQLPRRYAEATGIGFLQVPVQPRWDSPQDLMGFYNYIEGRFRPTDMARALYHLDAYNGPKESDALQDRMMLVLLDEMNLARVEYYFSDFLSRLESRPSANQTDTAASRKDSEIELELPMPKGQSTPRIFPGYNVLFAGTMNEDESTQSLSDKVVDRANILRFSAPKTIMQGVGTGILANSEALSRKQWRAWVHGFDALGHEKQTVADHVERMVGFMRQLQRPMGHRLGRAIMAYVANYPKNEGRTDLNTALADQVEMRLLPKLRGIEMDAAEAFLTDLAVYVEQDLHDHDLATAIRQSTEQAQAGTGQFVWRGVTRT
jgi:hypothetical protein